MKIDKTECSYQVTECDLKFGEQITLNGELLIPVSALDKIRAEIEREADHYDAYVNADIAKGLYLATTIVDKHLLKNSEMSDELKEHYTKLAEHYNKGAGHEIRNS